MDNIDGLKGMQKAHGVGMDTATLFSLEELFCLFFLNSEKILEPLNLTEASLVAHW